MGEVVADSKMENKLAPILTLLFTLIFASLLGYGLIHQKDAVENDQTVNSLPSFNPNVPSPSSTTTQRFIIGNIDVPSANIYALPITPGTDEDTLNTGMAGAYPWSSPGGVGVFAIAGHRVGAGGPFRQLNLVHIGDRFSIQTDSMSYIYRVISTEIVDPSDVSVLNGPADESRVVLITCTPLDTFAKRIVVTGKLISTGNIDE